MDILCRLSHAHVLPLLGYCLDHRGPSLVYPLAAGGNLEDRLLLTAQAPFRDASDVLKRGSDVSPDSHIVCRGGSGSGDSAASIRLRYRGLRAAGSCAR